MDFAFLDESGDNGKNGSKYLVLTLLCTHKKKQMVKIIRETKRQLLRNNKSAKWLNQKGGEIKFYGFPNKTLLKKVLKDLSSIQGNIYYMVIEKNGKAINPEHKVLIVGELFSHINNNDEKKVEKIIADLNFFNNNKENYFKLVQFNTTPINGDNGNSQSTVSFSQIDKETYLKSLEKKETVIKIEHHNSRLSEELQALDLLCGAIAHKFEQNNNEYFNLIKDNTIIIKGGNIDFKNK